MRDTAAEHEFFAAVPSNRPGATTRSRSGAGALWNAAARQLSMKGLKRTPPIWREARMFYELAVLRRDPIFRGVGLPEGEGRPVFLIPGYMAGDASLAPMATALRAAGFSPETAGVRLNVGCANVMVGPIEARLEAHVAANGGQKAFLIGQSRGGTFARWLATRRPDLVGGLVTLGTPMRDPLAVNFLVLVNLGLVGALGRLGLPGLLSTRCMRFDKCCEAAWREGTMPLPKSLPFLAVYSRSDGIVDWRACLAPGARHVEVESSHCGMAFNVDVLRAIGVELEAAKSPREQA